MEQDTERGPFVSKHPMHSLYLKIWTSQPRPLYTQNPLLPDQYTTKQNNTIGWSRLKFFIIFFNVTQPPYFHLWLGHQHPTSNAQNSVYASVCVDHRVNPESMCWSRPWKKVYVWVCVWAVCGCMCNQISLSQPLISTRAMDTRGLWEAHADEQKSEELW